MKNKILLCIIVVLSFTLMAVISSKSETSHSFFTEENQITIKNEDNSLETLNLDTYLIGVLAAEMPASFHEEALKAQAVASRTYALYKIKQNQNQSYDILTSVTNQAYITTDEMQKKWGSDYPYYYQKIVQAVQDTKDEIITYNNEIIEAFYFAMSNGQTEDAKTVFQEDLPYIKSTTSTWDNSTLNNFSVTVTFSLNDFCQKLNLTTCEPLNISNISKSDTNHINSVVINNQEFQGTELRTLLNLRSTDITFNLTNDKINITTKGYGHGVGMSQYGANGMAKEGYTYQEILKYYYNDVEINKIV